MSDAKNAGQVQRLLDIMARLRDPDGGCPWDLEQDFDTIAPYTVEEAHEVAEAIARGDLADLRDELGDLLLQVVFHAQLGREQGAFDFDDVVDSICEKMIRRHPHVFADAQVGDAEEQTRSWEAIKRAERESRGEAHGSALDGAGRGLPPLLRAEVLQRRAARTGFDWSEVHGPLDKVAEEQRELCAAVAAADEEQIGAELGDLLFSCVNVARHLRIDPGQALAAANARFEERFRAIEERAGGTDALTDLGDDEREALWEAVKRVTAPAASGTEGTA